MSSPEVGPDAGPLGFAQNSKAEGSGPPPPSLLEQTPPGTTGQLRPLTRRNTESKEGPKLLSEIVIQVSSNVRV